MSEQATQTPSENVARYFVRVTDHVAAMPADQAAAFLRSEIAKWEGLFAKFQHDGARRLRTVGNAFDYVITITELNLRLSKIAANRAA